MDTRREFLKKSIAGLLSPMLLTKRDTPLEKTAIQQRVLPQGYWKDFANVARELQNITVQYGRIPTMQELAKDRHSLAYAINYHGGLSTVRGKLSE